MEQENDPNKGRKIFLFSLLLLAIAGIAAVIVFTLAKQNQSVSAENKLQTPQWLYPANFYENATATNKLLTQQANSLKDLDKRYLQALTQSGSQKELDSLNTQIVNQENLIHKTIDSISVNRPAMPDSAISAYFVSSIQPFSTMLENRATSKGLRAAANAVKGGLNPDQAAILKSQSLLEEKKVQIIALENEIQDLRDKKNNLPPASPVVNDQTNAKDQQENNKDDFKITALTTLNNNLKLEVENLRKQLADGTKNNGESESVLKTKLLTLQQNVDMLNAELRLAQVDCNLSRVDAKQIIYTAKQRQQLLSEASGILTSLAKDDNADIRKKVQSKISRLNQVAANSKD